MGSSGAELVQATNGVFSLTISHVAPNDLHLYSVHGLFGSSVHLSQLSPPEGCSHVEHCAVHLVVVSSPNISVVSAKTKRVTPTAIKISTPIPPVLTRKVPTRIAPVPVVAPTNKLTPIEIISGPTICCLCCDCCLLVIISFSSSLPQELV